jgi:OOP family OmpA-OmpF porin
MRVTSVPRLLAAALLLAPLTAHASITRDIRGKVGEAIGRATTTLPDESVPARAGAAAVATAADPPGVGAWRDYAFVPGERTLWFDDFTGDTPGQPPIHFGVAQGEFSVAEFAGARALRTNTGGILDVDLPADLPQRFTIEVVWRPGGPDPLVFDTNTSQPPAQGTCTFGGDGTTAFVSCPAATVRRAAVRPGAVFTRERFAFDGDSAAAWLEAERLGESAAASVPRTHRVAIGVPAGGLDDPTLLVSLRIAAGGPSLEAELADSGRAVTHGIAFDPGSERMRPESTPVLYAIARTLAAHPAMRLTIDVHTDDPGGADANRTLSAHRAGAVRDFLVSACGVDATRLEARGWGADRPLVVRGTSWAARENRRVELQAH